MTKWIIALSFALTVSIGSLIWMAKPEVLEQNIRDIKAPVTKFLDERRNEKFAAAKAEAFNRWMRKYPTTPDCVKPHTDLKILECRNKDDVARQDFEDVWRRKIASGWEPE